eukprot:PRCOL_00000326-RA
MATAGAAALRRGGRVASGTLAPADAAETLGGLENARVSRADDRAAAAAPNGVQVLEDFARLDTAREARTGFPEVVWGPGKTARQIAQISLALAERSGLAVTTRVDAGMHASVLEELGEGDAALAGGVDIEYDAAARMLLVRCGPADSGGKDTPDRAAILGRAVVLSAGTADTPVAAECARMLELCGAETRYISDCGVAGLHRVLGELETIRAADVLVCVAGMDCALPSVVAGLVEAPVVAVPTSVGYGAAFGGAAALLSALNACAPGVSVVNIDNGYGGAMVAAKMLRRATDIARRSAL